MLLLGYMNAAILSMSCLKPLLPVTRYRAEWSAGVVNRRSLTAIGHAPKVSVVPIAVIQYSKLTACNQPFVVCRRVDEAVIKSQENYRSYRPTQVRW